MRLIAEGVYSQSGTYNANVVQCAAVAATMDVLAEPGLYERQRALGFRLAEGLSDARRPNAGSTPMSRDSARCFSCGSPTARSATGATRSRTPTRTLFTRWYQEMVVRGVLFHPLQFENLFVSLVHDDRDIDETLTAAADALTVVARSSSGHVAQLVTSTTVPSSSASTSARRR